VSVIEALILGIVQGLTEFLPVSSSGHLEIAKEVLGVKINSDDSLFFTISVHAATALSTIVVFRDDIMMLLRLLFEKAWWNAGRQYILFIIISMVPAVLVGLFYEKDIEMLFEGNLLLVGMMLIITGLLLYMTTRVRRRRGKIGFLNAFIIGVSQAIAIMPGISRSGATIGTSLLLGVEKTRAARFSFLMVVPLILGAMAKKIMDAEGGMVIASDSILPAAVGFVSAFITGLLACTWMVNLVKKSKLDYFAYYCFVIGVISIVFAF
tara:strand:- start:10877 stop:11674 length:798 start_codon:yes stop_codon:yes gene_type:complete